MLTEFDQTTIANMTAALDFVCKKIPADKDSNELRKRIGDKSTGATRVSFLCLQPEQSRSNDGLDTITVSLSS
jgi:hypothetical protein